MALLSRTALEVLSPACAAGAAPSGSVIWLHGLGANGHDFEPIVPMLDLGNLALRFILPHAPERKVTINGGYLMPAWYDILGVTPNCPQDEPGIFDSCAGVAQLIERERTRGVPTERILLAGFSQGGAIALHLGLRYPNRLAGIVALSSYLVRHWTLAQERSAANLGLPIFQAHGTYDPVVVFERGVESRDLLRELGYPLEWHTYPTEHSLCEPEIKHVSDFLREKLA